MSELENGHAAWQLWQTVRERKPLIQCITNFVSMDFMANTLLAGGAAPAMVSVQHKASACDIYSGTLSGTWVG